jgi:hypothetical protein
MYVEYVIESPPTIMYFPTSGANVIERLVVGIELGCPFQLIPLYEIIVPVGEMAIKDLVRVHHVTDFHLLYGTPFV